MSSTLSFRPLGSGREVGRSCHILKFKGKTVMLDCGIHPGKSGQNALPYLDLVDLSSVDLLLVSHFHLDHAAGLPHLLQHTNFKGRVFMTHPTLAVTKLLLLDYVRVSGVQRQPGGQQQQQSADNQSLYDDKDVNDALAKCERIDFHQQIEVDGIKFTAYNAGHVLGAAQFLIEIAGVRILYTGDFSREDDRHLMGAECNPDWRPDVLIVESTFGVQIHETQRERERNFVDAIEKITKRGGKCLIPVFSLGRAQELLLILEDHWSKNPELQQIPIYHASRLASMSLGVYRRFINAMNDRIKAKNDVANPWDLHHISNLENPNDFDEPGPAVVLASPGMLQNGASRRLFELWCGDPRNGTIIAGYSVEGTLAKEILKEPKEITALSGRRIPLNCQIRYISFTAHSDFPGTHTYIRQLVPRHTIFVHGEQTEMKRLHDEMNRRFSAEKAAGEMDFCMPENGQTVGFVFNEERVVKTLGRLAEKRARFEGAPVAGIFVTDDSEDKLVAPDELELFTQLSSTVLAQRLHVPFHARFDRLKIFVSKLFDCEVVTEPGNSPKQQKLKLMNEILLTHSGTTVLVEWRASPSNDLIVDSVIALLMQAESGVSGVRMSACFHHHHASPQSAATPEEEEENPAPDAIVPVETVSEEPEAEMTMDHVATLTLEMLRERYGKEEISFDETGIHVLEGKECFVDAKELRVESANPELKRDVESVVALAKRALLPISSLNSRQRLQQLEQQQQLGAASTQERGEERETNAMLMGEPEAMDEVR